jgi:hypothetical protein
LSNIKGILESKSAVDRSFSAHLPTHLQLSKRYNREGFFVPRELHLFELHLFGELTRAVQLRDRLIGYVCQASTKMKKFSLLGEALIIRACSNDQPPYDAD